MSETWTVAVLGTGVYSVLIAVFLAYPGDYDRRRKRRLAQGVLFANGAVAFLAGVALTLSALVKGIGFHLPDGPSSYLWAGTTVLAAQLLCVHVPIAFAFQYIHCVESEILDRIVRLAANMLYVEDFRVAGLGIQGAVHQHSELLSEAGLHDLAALLAERAESGSMRPVDLGRLLLDRATLVAVSARSRPTTPFRGLNEMLSAAGAGVIVALAVQLAL